MAAERDNFKAGLFVLVGIALALVVVFVLSDFDELFQRRQDVKVYFSISDGLQGLKRGAGVTLGDTPIGEVSGMQDVTQEEFDRLIPADQRPEGLLAETRPGPRDRVVGKLVTVTIPQRYQLYRNAVAELKSPPLGSGTKLNFRTVGDEGEYSVEGPPLVGGRATSELMRELAYNAGIEDPQREQIQQIIANVRDITGTLKSDLPEITGSAKRSLANIEPLTVEAKAAVDDLRAAAAEVKGLTVDVRQRSGLWMNNLDTITNKGSSSLTRVDKLLEDKDPDLRKTVENVRDITQQAKDQTMVQLTEILTKADASMANVKTTTDELKGFMVGQRPVLERMVANLQLSSDQLKLATIEIRRSPWRLLYKPDEKELETDNLYDAARSFALAAGTLDAATQSLQAVAEKTPNDQAKIEEMVKHLEALYERFEEAEAEFWKALKDNPGPGTPKE